MSGSYMNIRPNGGNIGQPSGPDVTWTPSRGSSSTVVEHDRRPPPNRRRETSFSSRPAHTRVISPRISQVYDSAAGEGRPACLHRATVSPALWLICQAVLVVIFAFCCVFLTSIRPTAGSSEKYSLSPAKKVWMRLEFDSAKLTEGYSLKETIYKPEAKIAYKWLICLTSGNETADHCVDMKNKYFGLSNLDANVSTVTIKRAAVYRINAVVTFRTSITFPVDVSVQINGEEWITCQEGKTSLDQYVHCALFGIQYLTENSIVSFKSDNPNKIAGNGRSTFFEIEML